MIVIIRAYQVNNNITIHHAIELILMIWLG